MLSFGVKIAWFVLSLMGLLCSTIVLWAFGSALSSRWGPMLYSFGNLLLQGMFCLGMIYRMDPFSMPRSFCLVQSILVSFGADLLAGVTLAFSLATYLAVLKPKTWSDGTRALRWRNVYALPIVAVPILASTAQTVVVLKLDTFHPTDDMHCDSTSPQWPRMLGYAGIPFLVSLPSLYLSTKSILQIRKTNKHLQRSRPDSFTDFKKSGPRVSRTRMRNISFIHHNGSVRGDSKSSSNRARTVSPPPPPPMMMMTTTTTTTTSVTTTTTTSMTMTSGNPAAASPGSPASASVRQYHLPFRPPSFHSVDERSKSNLSGRIDSSDRDDASSRVSVTFPTFVNPSLPPSAAHVHGAHVHHAHAALHGVDGSLPGSRGGSGVGESKDEKEKELTRKERNHRKRWEGDNINMEVLRGSVVVMDESGDWTEDGDGDGDGCCDIDKADLGSGTEEEEDDLKDVYAVSYNAQTLGKVMGRDRDRDRDRRGRSASPLPYRKPPRKEFPTLSPTILRIILFQFAYFVISILSSLSTFIDVVSKRDRPTPVGTQHVALLLAAWGPAFVFGHLPVVRSYLMSGRLAWTSR